MARFAVAFIVVTAVIAAASIAANAQGLCTITHFGGGGSLNLTPSNVEYLVAGGDTTSDGSGSRTPDLDYLGIPWTDPGFSTATPINGVPWLTGALPFGENIFCPSIIGDYSLPLYNPGDPTQQNPVGMPNTDFPRDSDLFIRIPFTAVADNDILVTIVKDNALGGLVVNGNVILSPPSFPSTYGPGTGGPFNYNYDYGNCGNGLLGAAATGVSAPVYLTIPGAFVLDGANLLAIRVHDYSGITTGNQSFFNIQLSYANGGGNSSHMQTNNGCGCFSPPNTPP